MLIPFPISPLGPRHAPPDRGYQGDAQPHLWDIAYPAFPVLVLTAPAWCSGHSIPAAWVSACPVLHLHGECAICCPSLPPHWGFKAAQDGVKIPLSPPVLKQQQKGGVMLWGGWQCQFRASIILLGSRVLEDCLWDWGRRLGELGLNLEILEDWKLLMLPLWGSQMTT